MPLACCWPAGGDDGPFARPRPDHDRAGRRPETAPTGTPTEGKLYLTDDVTNAIVAWDGERHDDVHETSSAPAGARAAGPTPTQVCRSGQLARPSRTKTFYVTRFGFGKRRAR